MFQDDDGQASIWKDREVIIKPRKTQSPGVLNQHAYGNERMRSGHRTLLLFYDFLGPDIIPEL
jgi:hypothetical protein